MVFQNVALLPHRSGAGERGIRLEVQKLDRRNAAASPELPSRRSLWGLGRSISERALGACSSASDWQRALRRRSRIILMDERSAHLIRLFAGSFRTSFASCSKSLKKSAIFITTISTKRAGSAIVFHHEGRRGRPGWTAEEIVLNPADGYVATSSPGISRLHLIKAHSVKHSVRCLSGREARVDVDSVCADIGRRGRR